MFDLKKATDHHEAVSNRHNADRDTLVTAEEIQKKNLKAFKADRDQTLDLSIIPCTTKKMKSLSRSKSRPCST